MTAYLILKIVHICAVVLFLGNIITGLFWMRHAKASGNLQIISHTMRGIIKSDKWFTIPGVVIILAGGIGAAIQGNLPLLRTGWIFWSIVLFSISGFAFSWKVVPLQQRIFKMTRVTPAKEMENLFWKEFQKQFIAWEIWGAVALITPIIAMVLMILKAPATTIFFK